MSASNRSLLSLNHGDRAAPARTDGLRERLHKVMANAGLGSRRALEQRIADGQVHVNDQIAAVGASVGTGDQITLDGQQYVVTPDSHEDVQVLMYNKPEGLLVTRDDEHDRPTIFEGLPHIRDGRWISVGRLDINTTGLLLLTNDGELANALMHPSGNIEREYLCRIHGEVPTASLEALKAGVELDDGTARFEDIVIVDQSASHGWFRVTLTEGRNREVRRLWESQGCQVSRLKRIRYAGIELPRRLRQGQNETLDDAAVALLRKDAGLSDPAPTLTLSPVIRQRRARRNVTKVEPERRSQRAWTGNRQDEARELTAYDRLGRDDRHGQRGRPHKPRGSRQDVNGNVAQPGNRGGQRRRKRAVAPGQELPSVRTWFAGDTHDRKPRGKNQRHADAAGSRSGRGPNARDERSSRGRSERGPGGAGRGPNTRGERSGGRSARGPGNRSPQSPNTRSERGTGHRGNRNTGNGRGRNASGGPGRTRD